LENNKVRAALALATAPGVSLASTAVSQAHPDHIGNASMFPQSTLLVQKAEHDWSAPVGPRFKPEQQVNKLRAITTSSATAV
jgi:glyoxylase-like metal-dependent hydrolase (beta-lactamase superfamily II)